jgi:hypothetical protein
MNRKKDFGAKLIYLKNEIIIIKFYINSNNTYFMLDFNRKNIKL